MSFTSTIALGFRRYGDFSGRARRSEFWWWILFTLLGTAALSAIPYSASLTGLAAPADSPFVTIWQVVVLLPTLAVLARRLRDAGFGWGHMFWLLLPVVGIVVLGVLALQPSLRTTRQEAATEPALMADPAPSVSST